jgi:hypothetical protein
MKKVKINTEIRPVLKKMEIGEVEMFPIEKSQSVRATCTQLGVSDNLVFKTRQLNELELIEVTRVN